MNAREMFEKLGYKEIENNAEEITYESKIKIDDWEQEISSITFWLNEKLLDFDNYINVNVLQAINKQVEELGWNNAQQ